MSVHHYLLAITDKELDSILTAPERIRELVRNRATDVVWLGTNGPAIVALTAESRTDSLGFMQYGAPHEVAGVIGEYVEENGRVVRLEVDMGYGPASFYLNSFLLEVSHKLEVISVDLFDAYCDLDWLEEHHVYTGGWHNEGRKEALVDAYSRYRECVLSTARAGLHLLVWCA